jgi:N4-gp56 family major capsid protein
MAYTTTATANISYVQTAYDLMTRPYLRPELFFDQLADVKPTRQDKPGGTVTFTIQNDLATATSAINESTDITPVAISSSQISVTLAEYGNAIVTTAKLRGESYIDIDEVVANLLGYNAAVSIDSVVRAVVQAGTNVNYSGGAASRALLTNSDTLSAADVRIAVATLRVQNVPTVGGSYWCFVHPAVSYDLRSQTGSGAWRTPHEYSQPGEIWAGEIGEFEGVRFIETPRAPQFAGASSSSSSPSDVFGSLFGGVQALAKAHSIVDGNGPDPHIVPGPVTDTLRRFVPVGWYQLVGYSVFRQPSLLRVESTSSIDSVISTYIPTIDNT